MSYTLTIGEPQLIPEMTFLFEGLKEEIDVIYWLTSSITDNLDNSGGYTTDLELEIFFPDADDISDLFEDQFVTEKDKRWTGVVVYYQEGKKAIKLTKGDQSNARALTQLYHSEKAAEKALNREYPRLNARKDLIQQVKAVN